MSGDLDSSVFPDITRDTGQPGCGDLLRKLSLQDCRILTMLDESGGFLTRRIAREITGVGRQQSAGVRQRLLRLMSLGLVTEMDDQKPVCWLRTSLGTAVAKANQR